MVNISSALSASIAMAVCSLFPDQARNKGKRLHGPSSDTARNVLCAEVKIGGVETNAASYCRNCDGNLCVRAKAQAVIVLQLDKLLISSTATNYATGPSGSHNLLNSESAEQVGNNYVYVA